jgi:hypothetical protein
MGISFVSFYGIALQFLIPFSNRFGKKRVKVGYVSQISA